MTDSRGTGAGLRRPRARSRAAGAHSGSTGGMSLRRREAAGAAVERGAEVAGARPSATYFRQSLNAAKPRWNAPQPQQEFPITTSGGVEMNDLRCEERGGRGSCERGPTMAGQRPSDGRARATRVGGFASEIPARRPAAAESISPSHRPSSASHVAFCNVILEPRARLCVSL